MARKNEIGEMDKMPKFNRRVLMGTIGLNICAEIMRIENAGDLTARQAEALNKIFGYGVHLQTMAGNVPCEGLQI